MPVIINGQNYYRPNEACKLIGISKATLLRWIKNQKFEEAYYRDKRGWRLFTQEQVNKLSQSANMLIEANIQKSRDVKPKTNA